jgi:ABC-type bacteriocin/lantibiotic exporter with double-glycine peptidase domain
MSLWTTGLSFLRREAGVFRPHLLILLVLLSASCATTGSASRPASSNIIEGVPFYPQEAYQCGPASLAALLNYNGADVTPGDIAAAIYSEGAGGTLGIDMVLYVREKGLAVKQYEGSLEDLKFRIDSGNPVIILVDYGFWTYQRAHFMVMVGYYEDGFIVNSGKEHMKHVSRSELKRIWEKTRFWTLAVSR